MTSRFDFTNVLHALPGSLLVLLPDQRFTIVDVSDAFLHASASRREDLVGSGYFTAFPAPSATLPDLRRDALDAVCLQRITQTLPPCWHDSHAASDGLVGTYWTPTLLPVVNANGELSAIILQFAPAGVQRSAADIHDSRLARAAEAAELGTFDYLGQRDCIVGNPAFMAHFFLPPDATLTSAQFLQLLHPDDRERTRLAMESAVHHGTPYDMEYRVMAPDGRVRWLRGKGRVCGNALQGSASFSGVTIDISASKQVEASHSEHAEESQLARAAAEHASLVKDEFLSTLSHELRTPLNSILGWTQVLQRSSARMSDKAITALATIERSARQQARLIDDLLDASAIMAGKIHLNLQPVRCSEVIGASVAISAPLAAARNIRIEVVIDEPGMAIEADQSRLQQILCRLLSNAIKFSTSDSTVTVRQMTSNDRVVITIADSGQGIAPAFLPSLFARFSQADGSITRSHMGLGLGLSIVKSLIELHGGSVSATSQGIARGATFTLELPTLQAGSPLQADAGAPEASDAAAREADWFADIVVVDDEADAGAVMQEILESAGARVRLASSATEALRLIRERRPDLLISDIGMPHVDGYQLLHLLRQQEPVGVPPLPAIAMTAFARPEDKRRAIEAGYLIHLAKPVETADLVTAAKLAVRRPSRMPGNR